MKYITNDWAEELKEEFEKEYFKSLVIEIEKAYEKDIIFPNKGDIFNAFDYTPLRKVKVVILGQDPYHNEGQAHGLCFSVKKGIVIPPSLVNIYKELQSDLECIAPCHGYLEKWSRQGVLMLNTVLTVKMHQAHSHRNIGWEVFTDSVIRILNNQNRPIVFILWGAPAQKKEKMLTNSRHLILKAPHPSPLSSYRGFFGSKPFSKSNEFLEEMGLEPIDWQIEEMGLEPIDRQIEEIE